MRCGLAGLRPTFGRVPRTGAMALAWSMDKLGPMARGVEDTFLVLAALAGPDPGDASSVPAHLDLDFGASPKGLRVGWFPAWMKDVTDVDRAALDKIKEAGMVPVEVSLPDWPYATLDAILFAESAASMEELTLSHGMDALKMQVADSWPNLARQSRFVSAVDYVQADRLRRMVAVEMARVLSGVDLLLVPSFSPMLQISNYTGHPSLTLRAGFVEVKSPRSDWLADAVPKVTYPTPRKVPHGVTLIGRLFDEGTLGRAGVALEKVFGVADARPAGFA
jgi:Asp-tRNA(Asn)/Glu-tRNA(Gln) amidotransferase A subunit family amidase